jgi:DNA-directed RNA polymerase specialized sigma24 family protein
MGVYYLVVDQDLKALLEKFSQCHPEGAKEVLKLVLKLYLKLVDKSRRKGSDPLLIFQNLVERIVTGKLYETAQDRIDHLDSLLEERQAAPSDNGSPALHQEIREIRSMLRDLQQRGVTAPYAGDLKEFSPKDAAKLLDLDKTAASQKKRKSYRELRKESGPKEIKF